VNRRGHGSLAFVMCRADLLVHKNVYFNSMAITTHKLYHFEKAAIARTIIPQSTGLYASNCSHKVSSSKSADYQVTASALLSGDITTCIGNEEVNSYRTPSYGKLFKISPSSDHLDSRSRETDFCSSDFRRELVAKEMLGRFLNPAQLFV
jgi:hypothetical protein